MFDTRSFINDGLLLPGISNNMVISSGVPESVPEPKTSVMMITALGLLGLVGGRRGPEINVPAESLPGRVAHGNCASEWERQ